MIERPKIQLQLVTWNSELYLQELFESIDKLQTKPDRIVCIDNGSRDGTLNFIQKRTDVQLIPLHENTGFSKAHNIGFQYALGMDYVLCVNPDIKLLPNALTTLLHAAPSLPRLGSLSGVLMRPLTEEQKISIVDCAGIRRNAFFQYNCISKKEIEAESSTNATLVDANTGACILLPITTIQRAGIPLTGTERIELFDEDMFAYKEDCDLGWRLQTLGFNNYCLHNTIAEHRRHIQKENSHRSFESRIVSLSHRNHLLMLEKNIRRKDLLTHGALILGIELAKLVYLFIIQPHALFESLKSWRHLRVTIRNKRKWILHQASTSH